MGEPYCRGCAPLGQELRGSELLAFPEPSLLISHLVLLKMAFCIVHPKLRERSKGSTSVDVSSRKPMCLKQKKILIGGGGLPFRGAEASCRNGSTGATRDAARAKSDSLTLPGAGWEECCKGLGGPGWQQLGASQGCAKEAWSCQQKHGCKGGGKRLSPFLSEMWCLVLSMG